MFRKYWIAIGFSLYCSSLCLQAEVNWIPTFKEAKEIAARENKFIVVDVAASWCGPCRKMAREVYPDPDFIAFTEDNVFMLVDAYIEKEGRLLAQQFDVQSFPTILVLNSDGEEIDRLSGGRDTKSLIKDLQYLFDNPIPSKELFRQAEEQPDKFEIQVKAGLRAYERDNFQEAEKYLSRAAKLSEGEDPIQLLDIYAALTVSRFKEERFRESLESLEKMTGIFTELPSQESAIREFLPLQDSLLLMKSKIYIELERHDEANALLVDLLKSSDPVSRKEARETMQKLPKKYRKDQETVEKQNEKAAELAQKNRLLEAEALVNNSLELAPENTSALLISAGVQIFIAGQNKDDPESPQRVEKALRQARMAMRLAPDDFNVYNQAKTLQIYSPAGYTFPRNPEAAKEYQKAEQNFARGKLDTAVKHYLKVMELEPMFSYTYLHLGDCFFASRQLEQALELYQQGIALAPLNPAGYRYAADACAKLGQSEKCREYLIDSVKADPSYPTVWAYMNASGYGKNEIERHCQVIPTRLLLCQADDDYEALLRDLPSRTLPAWRAYINKKLSYENRERKPGIIHWPSAGGELECLRELVSAWSALKMEDRELRDADLDFIRQVSIDGHLETFVFLELYTESYRPEFENWKKQNNGKINEYLENYIFDMPHLSLQSGTNTSALKAYNNGVMLGDSDPEASIASYRKALWQEPFMIPAMNNLSIMLIEAEKYEEALNVAEQWHDSYPDSPDAVNRICNACIKLGNFEKVVSLLEDFLNDKNLNREEHQASVNNLEMILKYSRQRLGIQ